MKKQAEDAQKQLEGIQRQLEDIHEQKEESTREIVGGFRGILEVLGVVEEKTGSLGQQDLADDPEQ